MKKIFIFIIAIAFLVSSCKKDNSEPDIVLDLTEANNGVTTC